MRKLILLMAFLIGVSYTVNATEAPGLSIQVPAEEQVDNTNQNQTSEVTPDNPDEDSELTKKKRKKKKKNKTTKIILSSAFIVLVVVIWVLTGGEGWNSRG